jgi:hypothetical protein
MYPKITVAAILVAGMRIWPAHAASTPTINATTLAASTVISPGRYTVTIAPSLNGEMSSRIEKEIEKVPGIESADAKAGDSTLHFTVKKGARVSVADIEKKVMSAHAGAVMSTPVLEHSLTANPGL